MSDVCGITGNLGDATCATGAPGTLDELLLIDTKDVKTFLYDTTTFPSKKGELKIITGAEFYFGGQAYSSVGRNNSIAPKSTYNGEGVGAHTHTLDFTAFGSDYETIYQVNELARGSFVAIVQTNNGDTRLLGRTGKMRVTSTEQDFLSADTGGQTRIMATATAKAPADFFAVYDNGTIDEQATQIAFDTLKQSPYYDIASIVIGTETRVVLNPADNPRVSKKLVGKRVFFDNTIVGTVGAVLADNDDGNGFVIKSVGNDGISFTIDFDTTGLVYTSGGQVR